MMWVFFPTIVLWYNYSSIPLGRCYCTVCHLPWQGWLCHYKSDKILYCYKKGRWSTKGPHSGTLYFAFVCHLGVLAVNADDPNASAPSTEWKSLYSHNLSSNFWKTFSTMKENSPLPPKKTTFHGRFGYLGIGYTFYLSWLHILAFLAICTSRFDVVFP